MPLSELDTILFIVNALAYVLLFAWYWRKDRSLNLRTAILLLYAGSAIVSPYAFQAIDDSFYNGIQIGSLHFFPFCYLFVAYLLLLSPLLRTNIQHITHFDVSNPRLLNIMTGIVAGIYVITIVFSELELADLFSMEKLMQNYMDTINNTIDGFKVEVSTIERITSILKGVTTDLVILLLAYHLLQHNKWGVFTMLLCMGYNIIYNLSIGQRAVILEVIMSIVLIFLVMRHAFSQRTRQILSRGLLIIGGITILAFGALTFARFADRDNSIADYIMVYYSESWYIFNNYGLDPGGCRYGDFTAPLVRRAMGKPCTNTMFESIDTFTTMHSNCSVFNTVVGDFTMDFGVLWASVILILYALLMHRGLQSTEGDSFPFAKLLFIIIAWRIASLGFIAFSYRGIGGNLQIVVDILLYLILSRKYVLKR